MIKKALDSNQPSKPGVVPAKKPPISSKRVFARVQTKMNAKERIYRSPLGSQLTQQ